MTHRIKLDNPQPQGESSVINEDKCRQVKIPLGLNRWLYVSIIFIFVIFHGAIIMNWTPLRSMLIRSDVYKWRCAPTDTLDSDSACGPQREGITMLGNLGQTSMFVGSALAGVIADSFGPRFCSVTGGFLFIISYLMLGLSSESVQMYIPYVLVQGLAIESSFFGVLTIPNLFPSHRGLMLSVLGAGRSLSMFYPVAMNKMTTSSFPIKHTAFTCLGVSAFFTAVCYLCLPTKPFRLLPTEPTSDLEHQTEITAEEEAKLGMREVLHYARQPFYLCWLAFFAFSFTRGTFYGLTVADQHRAVSDAFGIISPLSFVPCPLFGFMADWKGMLAVLTLLNTFGTMMFVCLIVGTNLVAQWIGVILSCLVLSFLASQCYCFIQEKYNENVRGRLAGASMCTAGLFSLVSTPIYNWASRSASFKGADGLFLGLSALCYVLLVIMWYTQETKFQDSVNTQVQKVAVEEPCPN